MGIDPPSFFPPKKEKKPRRKNDGKLTVEVVGRGEGKAAEEESRGRVQLHSACAADALAGWLPGKDEALERRERHGRRSGINFDPGFWGGIGHMERRGWFFFFFFFLNPVGWLVLERQLVHVTGPLGPDFFDYRMIFKCGRLKTT